MANQHFTTIFIDKVTQLESLLATIIGMPSSGSPSLFLDLEGISLSRHGSISLISLFIPFTNMAYLIDIHVLGSLAFTTSVALSDQTMKTILEDPGVAKVFFDVRNDSDALFFHYGVCLRGVIDLQLLELGSRHCGLRGKRKVNGLAQCIKSEGRMSAREKVEWAAVKDQGKTLFAPEKGGSYELFNERPLKEQLVNYSVQDVRFLPGLWETYTRRLGNNTKWRRMIEEETKERVRDSQSAGYLSQGRYKILGPWV